MVIDLRILALVYWVPAFVYLIIYSIRIRRKNKVTDLHKLGEAIIYGMTCYMGIFIVFLVKPKDVKNGTLP